MLLVAVSVSSTDVAEVTEAADADEETAGLVHTHAFKAQRTRNNLILSWSNGSVIVLLTVPNTLRPILIVRPSAHRPTPTHTRSAGLYTNPSVTSGRFSEVPGGAARFRQLLVSFDPSFFIFFYLLS